MFQIQKRENPEKMITGRATTDLNFVRLDRRRNPLHGCGRNPSSIYKRGASTSLRNQHSCVSNHTQRTRYKLRCLWIEGCRLQATDSFKHVVPEHCRWWSEGLRTLIRSRPSTTTSMANELPLGHGMCSRHTINSVLDQCDSRDVHGSCH
jgi:hypothetical protein